MNSNAALKPSIHQVKGESAYEASSAAQVWVVSLMVIVSQTYFLNLLPLPPLITTAYRYSYSSLLERSEGRWRPTTRQEHFFLCIRFIFWYRGSTRN
jgi:hypothetical protein